MSFRTWARRPLALGLLTLGVLGLALSACDGDKGAEDPAATTGPTTSQGRGKEPTVDELGGTRDTLVIASQSDFDTTISPVYQSANDSQIIAAVYGQSTNATFDCEITYEPEYFESWSIDATGTILSVKLRDDLQWADGVKLTTKDLKFTYDLIADPVVASPRTPYIEHMVPDKRPLVLDETHAEFHFTQPLNPTNMVAFSSLAIVPEHLLKDADRATLRGNPLGRNPVVSGSWKVEKWEPGSSVVLVPNDKFVGPAQLKPRLNRVVYRVLPEYSSRLVALQSGEVDAMDAILVADADRLSKEHPEIKLYRRGWRSMDYIAYNSFDPADYKAKRDKAGPGEDLDWSKVKPNDIFGDKAVRKAFGRAINADKMIADILTASDGTAYGRRSVSTITPALCKVHNNDIVPLPYDMALAKAELEAAGWKDSNGDSILDKNGKDLRFTLLINSGNARRSKAALIAQDNLRAIGADMQIESVESNAFFERLRKKDYEAALSGWSAALFVDMTSMWHSGEKFEFNFTGYQNPEVDRLVTEAVTTADPDRAAELNKQAQALIYEDQPYTFLYWFDEIVGVNSRFKDAQVNIMSAYQDLYRWWVPSSEVKYPR